MTAAVKLSRRAAETCRRALGQGTCDPEVGRAIAELERALQPKPKSSAVRKTERKRREKLKETRSIYEQVAERAEGICEGCRVEFNALNLPELDHQRGRGKARQALQNCWMLCRRCHRAKTDGKPSRLHWLSTFREHCYRLDYVSEARRVEADMDFERAKRGGA